MDSDTTSSHRDFVAGLKAGYIDASVDADERSMPRFLVNDPEEAVDVLSVLKSQLTDCDSFDFSVAFITESGLQTLVEMFGRMKKQGIPGRILTSTYQNFNKPEALEKLLEYDNIETRIYQGDMHAKGYFFSSGNLSTIIVGSANLTQAALRHNKEWNVLLRSYKQGGMFDAATDEFEKLWNSAETMQVTHDWIEGYRAYLNEGVALPVAPRKPTYVYDTVVFDRNPGTTIEPNEMQFKALESLSDLRGRGESKGLLISATGTGKTYLAALDVAQAKPEKVLFVVHRERILKDAQNSFSRVLGNAYTYGFYSGTEKHRNATCLFAMSTTLSGHLGDFAPDEFDYVIIDEAHRSAAKGYREILGYFTSRFLLGMTATPNRTDGADIFALYDNNIAYKITLRDALESDMLVPFHYFGIQDLTIDEEEVDDTKLFARLTGAERVNHVVRKIEEYSVGRRGRKGLVFCSRKDEAKSLAASFRQRGYKALALTGEDGDSAREQAIRLLENSGSENGEEYLEYLFTVDIFNEGVDIPPLNQIIMLRPTESAIIFVQQLGRGLRKCREAHKEYTLVLDFIGNYQTNYLIPVALSGDRTYNKDNLRVFVKEGATTLKGCSTINFDQVSEKRVLKSIDGERFGTVGLVKAEYASLRNELGRIPRLMDFDTYDAIDPLLMFSSNTLGSYHAFLKKYEPSYTVSFSKEQESILNFVSLKLAAGKRPHELLLLRSLIDQAGTGGDGNGWAEALSPTGARLGAVAARSVDRVLTNKFAASAAQRRFAACVLVEQAQGKFRLAPDFIKRLADDEFRAQILEVIDFGLHRFERDYGQPYAGTDFQLNRKYTYEDVCRLLGWAKNETPLNIGGYKYDRETNTFPVFINYQKAPDITETTKYEDRFISPRELIAISKQGRSLSSNDIQTLMHAHQTDTAIYLFVRKNKEDRESKEFYFLGRIHPTGVFREITMANTSTSAVEIHYRLETPVRADLYDYFTTQLADE